MQKQKKYVEKLVVKKVVVNQAVKGRRRTYRAHGRINAYLSSNCHYDIVCEELKEKVKKRKLKMLKQNSSILNNISERLSLKLMRVKSMSLLEGKNKYTITKNISQMIIISRE